MSDWNSSDDDIRVFSSRFRVLYLTLGFVATVVFMRLWFLQIIEGDELREYSEKNRMKETKIAAPRGLFLDREGRILVDNLKGFTASISPQYASNLEETASAVAGILGLKSDDIVNRVRESRRKSGPFFPAVIKENLTLDEVFRLKRIRMDHPGLNVTETVLRYYPLEENGAQLFGYVGEISKRQLEQLNKKYQGQTLFNQGDIVGRSGLEEIWDLDVRGRDGMSFIEVDAHGRESRAKGKEFFDLKPQPEEPGNSMVLTLDRDMQEAAYKAMLEQKDATGPRIGALVAMKTNGEILAWVSTPSFSPNPFAHGTATDIWTQLKDHPFKPLRNKAIQDHYAPGSTLKPIVALAALQEGVVTANTIVNAPGQMRFGNRVYHDSLKQGHGDINIMQAIESSSNIFFYKMGIQLGIDAIAKYAKALGLGERSGVGLANEAVGVFPTKEWKLKVTGEPWQPGENLSNAIGQGFVLVNLMQMAIAYNTIATDGKVVRPLLIKKLIDPNNKTVKEFEPTVVRDISAPNDSDVVVDKKHIKTVREGMRRVANGERGTARWWKIPGVQMAGKTGTSQVMGFSADEIYVRCETRPIHMRHHGSFVAFAPAENPVITIAALTEHACHGSTGAAPVVRDLFLAYFKKYYPELIKTKTVAQPVEAPAVRNTEEIVE